MCQTTRRSERCNCGLPVVFASPIVSPGRKPRSKHPSWLFSEGRGPTPQPSGPGPVGKPTLSRFWGCGGPCGALRAPPQGSCWLISGRRVEPNRSPLCAASPHLFRPTRQISAVSVLEAVMVLGGRRGPDAAADLDVLLRTAAVRVIPTGLNFIGLRRLRARTLVRQTAPVELKGADFSRTDIVRVR